MEREVYLSMGKESDKFVLRNLLNLYLYDLSEYTGMKVNQHGWFEYRRLDQYWYDDLCLPFFITVSGQVAGFVLVHQYGLLEDGRKVVSEFFVMRPYRQLGIGKRAAEKLFEMFPGAWEVSELPENVPSLMFWRRVIHDCTGGNYSEVVIENRPVQYFEI